MSWIARIVGVILILLGALWFLQGVNVIPVGFMAGHLQYSALGAVAIIVGAGLIWWVTWRRTGRAPTGGTGMTR